MGARTALARGASGGSIGAKKRGGGRSVKEIPLRHGQLLGGGAGEEFAVGADLVGFGVHLDRGGGAVHDHGGRATLTVKRTAAQNRHKEETGLRNQPERAIFWA